MTESLGLLVRLRLFVVFSKYLIRIGVAQKKIGIAFCFLYTFVF